MKLPVITAILILTIFVAAKGQNTTKIVVISSADSLPVAGAHILTGDSLIKGTTNNEGICMVSFPGNSVKIRISHLAFRDTTVILNPSCRHLIVSIQVKTRSLPAFSVYANPVNIIPDKPWFVTSYLHCREGLLLLAYPRRKLSNQSLFLLNNNNEVIASVPWNELGTLSMDAAGEVWLKCKSSTRKVDISPGNIFVSSESIPTIEYEAGIERINLIIDGSYYFGHYRFDNQWLDYYCYNEELDKSFIVESISDPLGLKLRETRDIFETNEFERRFGEMCFFAPVFAPIHKYGNGFVIFDFAQGNILFFNSLNLLTNKVKMNFFKEKNLLKKLLHDPVEGRFFAVIEDKGVLSVCEIDILSGVFINRFTIPSFYFIDQISVYNGHVYFLYKEETFHEYRKIFRMNIPDNTMAVGI